MDVVVRAPRPQEADHIAALHVATWREAYAHLLPADFFTRELETRRQVMWRSVLADERDDRTVRVVERDGGLVGFGFAGPAVERAGEDAPRAEQLYSVYLLASEYGSGAGQALLDAVLGGRPAQLWVAKDNPRAIAFYLRNGFVADGAEDVDPATPRMVAMRMVR